MKLYNTLTNKKEIFSPSENNVKMYVCGITPYAASHLGHAMSSVIFDVIRRYLEFKGYEVTHIQNFTDIDDKMIDAATKENIGTNELAEKNIDKYLEEMDTLNVLRAHVYPKATEEIEAIVEIINTLIENSFAYEIDGDVYFRVKNDTDYGKLSGRTLDDMMTGARVKINDKKAQIVVKTV